MLEYRNDIKTLRNMLISHKQMNKMWLITKIVGNMTTFKFHFTHT